MSFDRDNHSWSRLFDAAAASLPPRINFNSNEAAKAPALGQSIADAYCENYSTVGVGSIRPRDPAFTIDEADNDYSVLEINNTKVVVKFKISDDLTFKEAGPGDVQAIRERGFHQFVQFLYEIAGRPEIQKALEDKGLVVEREKIKK